MTRWIAVTPVHLAPTGTAGPELLQLELSDAPSPAVTDITVHPDDPLGAMPDAAGLPGSRGEHLLQRAFGTVERANRFYRDQVLDHLNTRCAISLHAWTWRSSRTSDAAGECDVSSAPARPASSRCSASAGSPTPSTAATACMASLGNISENAHVAMLMVDFATDLIGLHVNGRARIVDDAELRAEHPDLPTEFDRGRTPERWVVLEVVEAYIHCRKHIPRLVPVDSHPGLGHRRRSPQGRGLLRRPIGQNGGPLAGIGHPDHYGLTCV